MPKIVDHDARRFAISEATAGLIAQGGLEAVTIREIARVSGYTKGVIGHYFEDKEELIDGALAWANRCYEQRVMTATRGQRGVMALRRRIEATVPGTKRVRDEWKVRLVFWSMAAIKPDLRRSQQKRFALAVESFEGDLRQAIALGEIAADVDAHTTARHLVNMITGISTAALHNSAVYTPATIAAEIDFLVHDFCAAKELETP
ncbi:MAG: TetR/AcrR family transcriptional regulator [Halioglobus sp.]|nr:TetR/AcrR family transcriptional regulator [Halioglobus sp.]